jgi:hypothetical protein
MATAKQPTIRCLLDVWIEGLFFNPARPKGIAFAVGGKRRVSIHLKGRNNNSFGLDRELECRVTGRFEVSAFERQFIGELIEGRFLSYGGRASHLPLLGKKGRVLIDAKGKIASGYHPTRDLYPKSLQEKCEFFEKELSTIATRFLKLLRWQQVIEGPPQPIQHAGLYWQVKRGPFHVVGHSKGGPVARPWPAGMMWEKEDQLAFSKLWRAKSSEEPLAHELLRESKFLSATTPRSALLIAASALEVGAKSHIAKLLPVARWLVENVPSPPTHKIFRDYISHLPTPVTIDWSKLKPLFTVAQRLAEERNVVAHSSGHIPSGNELDAYLDCVSDLLYIIDVSQGHEWAKEHVTKRTRDLLNWTLSRKRKGRGFVTMTIED